MNKLKVTSLELEEVKVLEYSDSYDNRGRSYPIASKKELSEQGIHAEFVEEILYCPEKSGTLYGIHFQNEPFAQSKLLFCIDGKGLDYAVDLRKDSATYKQWVCVEISADNRKQIFIPKGFGHVFLSMEDNTRLIMKIDNYFEPGYIGRITYNDPEIGISYPVSNPILSEKDACGPLLKDCNINLH